MAGREACVAEVYRDARIRSHTLPWQTLGFWYDIGIIIGYN